MRHLPEQLLADGHVTHLKKGQFAFRLGDHCNAYLVLRSGTVRVQLISDQGREITLYRIGPGNSCVLTTSCLLSKEDYPAEAIAETDLEAVVISRRAFREALESSPEFRTFVFDDFSQRLTGVIERIAELAFTSIDSRLARALLRLDREAKEDITHQELGVELGTAREVVSRHLKRFEDQGLVRLGRGKVVVADVKRLQEVASYPLGD